MPDEDDRRLADVQALLGRLDGIDELFAEERASRNLQEKLADAAADIAEKATDEVAETRRLLRTVIAVVAVGLLVWTPIVAYGAVWFHELVRNTCYPVAELAEDRPVDEAWYCDLFPGTGRHPDHPA